MKIQLEDWAYEPIRAFKTDAGLDLRSPIEIPVFPKSSVVIDTGVRVQLPKDTAGLLMSKSGLNVKHGITSEGVIDYSYTGTIRVKLYNNSDDMYLVHEGDKITQLVIVPIMIPVIEIVDSIEKGERGENGFGSSGK